MYVISSVQNANAAVYLKLQVVINGATEWFPSSWE